MGLGQETGSRDRAERGYAMAALLVGMSIMAVMMTVAMPVWSQFMKREREEELIWRGQQYARAVGLFQRKYANTFPPTIDILVEQRFLRKKYKDPITNQDFQPIPAGGGLAGQIQPIRPPGQGGAEPPASSVQSQPPRGQSGNPPGGQTPLGGQAPSIGISGVVSRSKDSSIKIYNGRTKYNEWAFVYLATAQRVVGPGLPPNGQGAQPNPRGGTGFTPLGGTSVRPGVGPSPFGPPGQQRPGGQFPQPPPQSPFAPPPFGGQPPPSRPPGS